MFSELFKENRIVDACRKLCDCCVVQKRTRLDTPIKFTIRIPSNIPATIGSGPPSASSVGSGPQSASSLKSPSGRGRPDLFIFPRLVKETHRSIRTDSDSSSRSLIDSSSSHRSRFDSSTSSDRSRNESCSSPMPRIDSFTSVTKGSKSPFIDMKPIMFFPANRENVQPKSPRIKMVGGESSFDVDNFQIDLYSEEGRSTSKDDEQRLAEHCQLGEIHFSLRYDFQSKSLHVRIIEAKSLSKPIAQDEARSDMSHSNPYVKLCVHPNVKDAQQSSVQKKTQNPVWNETFTFVANYADLQSHILEITVNDFDKFSRHCVIGGVQVPLSTVDLVQGRTMTRFLTPCPKKKPDLGEILLSINYLPCAGRLNVDVIKAHQLLQTDMTGGSDTFVKISLLLDEKIVKTKKTSLKKNTIDPVFNECISFSVVHSSLNRCSIVITVWAQASKSRDSVIGRIVLGRFPSGSHEASHWLRMISCQRSAVAQWHSLKTVDECDQCSVVSQAVSS